ncbi:hypothetical protein ACIBKY_32990 [Nonomuraea sp. NPDC050394]|uniref:hypothetical protein n=1 Tax=Nonomuraea sp. NPDC050394 TaxID=3364363 RepID=UPI0037BBBC09
MTASSAACETRIHVSVQRVGMHDAPGKGHVAAGLLVGRDTVLVPNPPAELLDTERPLEVLVIPTPLDQAQPVERLGIEALLGFGAQEGKEGITFAVIRLAGNSRYPSTLRAGDSREVNKALRKRTGMWKELHRLGLIDDENIKDGPRDDVWQELPGYDRKMRAYRTRIYGGRRGGDCDICQLIVWPCEPPEL